MVRLVSNHISARYDDSAHIDVAFTKQWIAYKRDMGRFMLSSDEQRKFNNSALSIYQYWYDRLEHKETDLLATIAIAMIDINPTEASVERSFSAQKLVHNLLRYRLNDDLVEAQTFIKTNGPLLTAAVAGAITYEPDEWTIVIRKRQLKQC